MQLKAIIEKAGELNKIQQQIDTNRRLWNESKRALITDTLTAIQKQVNLPLEVQHTQPGKNWESVNVHFTKSASGIEETSPKKTVEKMKQGGALYFSQVYNGDIYVLVGYPMVEGHTVPLEEMLIGKTRPEQLTESYIISMFEKFLDAMIHWETGGTPDPIGFKVHSAGAGS